MSDAESLFSHAAQRGKLGAPAPLADRMRPVSLDELVGQQHLLGPRGALRRAIVEDRVPSMILWGDPGCGKTTIAHVISRSTQSEFEAFSAVLGGVAELREIIARAKERMRGRGRRTLLFVDEIHRFNRAQQDAFLPHVENGTVILIGATTENPSFAINNAVLSRATVFRLKPLEVDEVQTLLSRALADARGYGGAVSVDSEALTAIASSARGDGRRALSALENLVAHAGHAGKRAVTIEDVQQYGEAAALQYDKSGDQHYDVVSALIKSLRGSDPDAGIYWMMRMLEGGEDPLFVSRRLIIFASEDVGNADPRALSVALDADAAFRRLGMPEGIYPLAHACLYLASCPKSNAVKLAWQGARAAVEKHGALPVPLKLRNAPTRLMKEQGHGADYRYAHDYPGAVVPGEVYLPDALVGERYYQPSEQGLEQAIGERLARLRSARGRAK